jgi:hypothetical protein
LPSYRQFIKLPALLSRRTGGVLIAAIGAAMDRNEARHSRAEQPPEPPYSRTIDL